jgi:hypothetical protein
LLIISVFFPLVRTSQQLSSPPWQVYSSISPPKAVAGV